MESNKLLDKKKEDIEDDYSNKIKNSEQLSNNPNSELEKHGYPTMDNILNIIGYTNYHFLLVFGCCSFYFSEGAQLYAFNLLMPIYNVILHLNSTKHLLLSSICYFGYAFGSFFVGTLTKHYNRKMPLMISLIFYSLFSILVILFQNFYWIILCRFIIGLCIGIISSLYLSNMSEYLPIFNRELTIGLVLSSYVLGILFYIYTFKIIMPDYMNFEKWRIILLLTSLPCTVSCIFSLFIIRDSPRLLFNKDCFVEGIIELRTLTNNTCYQLTDLDQEKLKNELAISKSKKIEFSFLLLFSPKFRILTTINLLLLLTTSAAYVSNFYSLPLILYSQKKKHSEMFSEIILAQSFSIPAILLASILAGIQSIGRKYSIAIGFAISFGVALIASIMEYQIIVCCSLINFFIMISYFLSKVYLIESFPSKLRDHGMSIIFVVARIAESVSPSICELMFKLFEFGPLLWICLLCLIGVVFALLIPFETRGEAIDSKI